MGITVVRYASRVDKESRVQFPNFARSCARSTAALFLPASIMPAPVVYVFAVLGTVAACLAFHEVRIYNVHRQAMFLIARSHDLVRMDAASRAGT